MDEVRRKREEGKSRHFFLNDREALAKCRFEEK